MPWPAGCDHQWVQELTQGQQLFLSVNQKMPRALVHEVRSFQEASFSYPQAGPVCTSMRTNLLPARNQVDVTHAHICVLPGTLAVPGPQDGPRAFHSRWGQSSGATRPLSSQAVAQG